MGLRRVVEYEKFSYQQLILYGVHIGHSFFNSVFYTAWLVYTYTQKILILNLYKSLKGMRSGLSSVLGAVGSYQPTWFINLDQSASIPVRVSAFTCGEFSATSYWINGFISNYNSVYNTYRKLKKMSWFSYPGRNKNAKDSYRIWKLTRVTWPRNIFISNVCHSYQPAKESLHLGIPCLGIVDSNTYTHVVSVPIPGNDDSIECLIFYNDLISKFILSRKFALVITWYYNIRKKNRLIKFREWCIKNRKVNISNKMKSIFNRNIKWNFNFLKNMQYGMSTLFSINTKYERSIYENIYTWNHNIFTIHDTISNKLLDDIEKFFTSAKPVTLYYRKLFINKTLWATYNMVRRRFFTGKYFKTNLFTNNYFGTNIKIDRFYKTHFRWTWLKKINALVYYKFFVIYNFSRFRQLTTKNIPQNFLGSVIYKLIWDQVTPRSHAFNINVKSKNIKKKKEFFSLFYIKNMYKLNNVQDKLNLKDSLFKVFTKKNWLRTPFSRKYMYYSELQYYKELKYVKKEIKDCNILNWLTFKIKDFIEHFYNKYYSYFPGSMTHALFVIYFWTESIAKLKRNWIALCKGTHFRKYRKKYYKSFKKWKAERLAESFKYSKNYKFILWKNFKLKEDFPIFYIKSKYIKENLKRQSRRGHFGLEKKYKNILRKFEKYNNNNNINLKYKYINIKNMLILFRKHIKELNLNYKNLKKVYSNVLEELYKDGSYKYRRHLRKLGKRIYRKENNKKKINNNNNNDNNIIMKKIIKYIKKNNYTPIKNTYNNLLKEEKKESKYNSKIKKNLYILLYKTIPNKKNFIRDDKNLINKTMTYLLLFKKNLPYNIWNRSKIIIYYYYYNLYYKKDYSIFNNKEYNRIYYIILNLFIQNLIKSYFNNWALLYYNILSKRSLKLKQIRYNQFYNKINIKLDKSLKCTTKRFYIQYLNNNPHKVNSKAYWHYINYNQFLIYSKKRVYNLLSWNIFKKNANIYINYFLKDFGHYYKNKKYMYYKKIINSINNKIYNNNSYKYYLGWFSFSKPITYKYWFFQKNFFTFPAWFYNIKKRIRSIWDYSIAEIGSEYARRKYEEKVYRYWTAIKWCSRLYAGKFRKLHNITRFLLNNIKIKSWVIPKIHKVIRDQYLRTVSLKAKNWMLDRIRYSNRWCWSVKRGLLYKTMAALDRSYTKYQLYLILRRVWKLPHYELRREKKEKVLDKIEHYRKVWEKRSILYLWLKMDFKQLEKRVLFYQRSKDAEVIEERRLKKEMEILEGYTEYKKHINYKRDYLIFSPLNSLFLKFYHIPNISSYRNYNDYFKQYKIKLKSAKYIKRFSRRVSHIKRTHRRYKYSTYYYNKHKLNQSEINIVKFFKTYGFRWI